MNEPLGKYADAVVAIDHQHFCITVGIDRMVGETDLVAFARGVYHKI